MKSFPVVFPEISIAVRIGTPVLSKVSRTCTNREMDIFNEIGPDIGRPILFLCQRYLPLGFLSVAIIEAMINPIIPMIKYH